MEDIFSVIDELIELTGEYKLETKDLKKKIESIEQETNFYDDEINEDDYREYLKKA